MKKLIYTAIALILWLSCNNSRPEKIGLEKEMAAKEQKTETAGTNKKAGQTCWKGTLNSKINVFLHYQIHDGFMTGAITYLDTKENTPPQYYRND